MQVSSFLFINGQIISVFSVRTRGGCFGPLHRKNLPNKRSRAARNASQQRFFTGRAAQNGKMPGCFWKQPGKVCV